MSQSLPSPKTTQRQAGLFQKSPACAARYPILLHQPLKAPSALPQFSMTARWSGLDQRENPLVRNLIPSAPSPPVTTGLLPLQASHLPAQPAPPPPRGGRGPPPRPPKNLSFPCRFPARNGVFRAPAGRISPILQSPPRVPPSRRCFQLASRPLPPPQRTPEKPFSVIKERLQAGSINLSTRPEAYKNGW